MVKFMDSNVLKSTKKPAIDNGGPFLLIFIVDYELSAVGFASVDSGNVSG